MISLSDPTISNPVLSSLKIKSEDKIIFIRENSLADSNFVITHLLKQLLYHKSRICFLTLHNNFDHYQSVGKKLGYDLGEVVERGDVKIVDPLEKMVENIGREFGDNIEDPRIEIIKCVYNTIEKQIETFNSTDNQPIYMVIDDVSHFLDLGVDLAGIIEFANQCINLTSKDNVFAVINSHVGSKSDLIVANSIQYACDVFICVSPLKTGNSTDITGVMTVQRGDTESRYHYRAFDRGVKTFHPGDTIYNLYQ